MFISRMVAALVAIGFFAGCGSANTASLVPAQSHVGHAQKRPMDSGPKELYVANGLANEVDVYQVDVGLTHSLTLARSIKVGLSGPHSLAFDSSGDLFVANNNDTVTEYAQGGSRPIATISTGVSGATVVALDRLDNLWVANRDGDSVTKYSPPYSSASAPVLTITSGVSDPEALAFQGNGNITVANAGNNTVSAYNLTTGGHGRTISDGIHIPKSLAYDSDDTLYVGNTGTDTITVYAPGQTARTRTINDPTVNDPVSLVADESAGYIWAANRAGNNVSLYDPNGAVVAAFPETKNSTGFRGACAVIRTSYFIAAAGSFHVSAVGYIEIGGGDGSPYRPDPSSMVDPSQVSASNSMALAAGP